MISIGINNPFDFNGIYWFRCDSVIAAEMTIRRLLHTSPYSDYLTSKDYDNIEDIFKNQLEVWVQSYLTHKNLIPNMATFRYHPGRRVGWMLEIMTTIEEYITAETDVTEIISKCIAGEYYDQTTII